nr:immunoglobulin light chain junction region [Macaca mulatta]MOY01395.1 immunoglobulin light chain junction region [Macaca mulatta]MOY10472.1 immunoglobulin light chain junction region [Macaca mulatta]
CMQALEVPWTF